MTRESYELQWNDSAKMRVYLQELIQQSPELFPSGVENGFHLTGQLSESRKIPGVRLRQLRLLDGRVFTLRPSFVTRYMTGVVGELENPLLLLSFGVPCWLVTRIFGHNEMYWYRQVEGLGRNSIVGTTVRDPERLPEHLLADEHHTDWSGEKGYVPLTVGGGCVLSAALCRSADEDHLTAAYGQFAAECREVKPDYEPKSVNTDGWCGTQNAFRALFPTIIVVLCYLHGFLKIRDRCRKLRELHRSVWDVYRAATANEFRQRMAAFRTWCQAATWPKAVLEALEKLWNRESDYVQGYSHPACHRTSNQCDRLMNRLTRWLYAGRGLHGHQHSSELHLRGWALLHNFRPFALRAGKPRVYQSPAHRLNRKQYHPNWLHNLQVCTSLAGRRICT